MRYIYTLSHFSHVRFCDPMDYSLPGSSVHGILQARILEWVVMSSFRGSPRPKNRTLISYVSCIGRQVLYHWHHLRSLYIYIQTETEITVLYLPFSCNISSWAFFSAIKIFSNMVMIREASFYHVAIIYFIYLSLWYQRFRFFQFLLSEMAVWWAFFPQ